MYIIKKYGTTRTVYLIGNIAIKIPSRYSLKHFLYGWLGNIQENTFNGLNVKLCPVKCSILYGLIVVMPKCTPINQRSIFQFKL